MSDVNAWNVTAASNNSAAPDGAPEGMVPSGVNDTIREVMAAVKRRYADSNGSLTSTGSSGAYAVTANEAASTYYDGQLVAFETHQASAGSDTLAWDGGDAEAIVWPDGTALAADDLPSGAKVQCVYDLANTRWLLWTVASPPVKASAANVFTANQTIRSADDGASAGPTLTLDRNSASPAASDVIGAIPFTGRDSGGGTDTYAQIQAQIITATASSEDGILEFYTKRAGTEARRAHVSAGLVVGAPTGGDKGAGTVNATEYYKNGAALPAPIFTESFTSTDQTITSAGALTIAHGLSAAPKMIVCKLKCTTGELGFTADDELFINPNMQDGTGGSTNGNGVSVVADATNLNIRYGNQSSAFNVIRKDTGALTSASNANWKFIISAYA